MSTTKKDLKGQNNNNAKKEETPVVSIAKQVRTIEEIKVRNAKEHSLLEALDRINETAETLQGFALDDPNSVITVSIKDTSGNSFTSTRIEIAREMVATLGDIVKQAKASTEAKLYELAA